MSDPSGYEHYMEIVGQITAETHGTGFLLGQIGVASSIPDLDHDRLRNMLIALDADSGDIVDHARVLQRVIRDMIANAARNAGIDWPAERKES